MANPSRMNKKDLFAFAKSLGITASEGMTKKDMLIQIKSKSAAPKPTTKPAPKPATKPAPKATKIVGKPVMIPQKKTPKAKPVDKTIWQTIKDFFGA